MAVVTRDRKHSIYMGFPYNEHSLAGLPEGPSVKLSTIQSTIYLRQLLTGTEYPHQNKILYRDLKAVNLLDRAPTPPKDRGIHSKEVHSEKTLARDTQIVLSRAGIDRLNSTPVRKRSQHVCSWVHYGRDVNEETDTVWEFGCGPAVKNREAVWGVGRGGDSSLGWMGQGGNWEEDRQPGLGVFSSSASMDEHKTRGRRLVILKYPLLPLVSPEPPKLPRPPRPIPPRPSSTQSCSAHTPSRQ
ncbi:hypothetical protein BDV93DRAFT_608594 [Ceratobasidium sp. AG-I]|nr:hypothetical protein BDV93DRAFT_608594 [Ceratobasidium sp. AG-I]